MGVVDVQDLHIQFVQAGLYAFPFPTFGVFVVIDLDFLNVADGFYPVATVFGEDVKVFPIQLSSDFQENKDPEDIEDATAQKDEEDGLIEDQQDGTEYDKGDGGEDHA